MTLNKPYMRGNSHSFYDLDSCLYEGSHLNNLLCFVSDFKVCISVTIIWQNNFLMFWYIHLILPSHTCCITICASHSKWGILLIRYCCYFFFNIKAQDSGIRELKMYYSLPGFSACEHNWNGSLWKALSGKSEWKAHAFWVLVNLLRTSQKMWSITLKRTRPFCRSFFICII